MLPSTRVVLAGPASLYPAMSLHDVGIDSNVYDEQSSPREDFTYSVTPRLYAVVPIGGTRFVGTGRGDFVYYRSYKDQQSINAFFDGRYEVVEARIRPFASASFATHRERQSLEIDARARQTQSSTTIGSDFEITAVTSLTGWARREHTSWDRSEQYRGFSLSDELDSTTDMVAAGARFRFTGSTSLTTVAEIQRDRFERSPLRDADSMRLAPTLEFDSGSPLTGHARVGFRAFRPLNPAIEDFEGLTASADLRYVLDDTLRIYFDGGRDLRYSFDSLQPYYLESGVRARLVQRIVGPFEGILMGERWQIRHQRIGGRSFDGRQEDTATIGGGVGIRLSREMEMTFTLDRTTRTSSESVERNFERHRAFVSISYGL